MVATMIWTWSCENAAWFARRVSPLVSHPDPVQPCRARGTAEMLLSAAAAEKALMVMGGYSHSRLREWVFGGVTRRECCLCHDDGNFFADEAHALAGKIWPLSGA